MRCSSTTPTKFSNAVAKAQNEMTSPVDLVGKNKELLCPRLPQPLNKSAEGSPDQLIGCVPQCHLGLVSCNATSVWHPSTPGTVRKAYYSFELVNGHTVSCSNSAITSSWLKIIYAAS